MTFTAKLKADDEHGRLAALKRYQILDTAPEVEFEDIISLVKTVLNAPIAAISLIDSDRQWFKAISGVDVTETPRSIAFCDHTIRDDRPLKVADATRDSRFSGNPMVTGAPGVRYYLGVPLRSPDGYNIGSLCILGHTPRDFSEGEIKVLQSFASLIVSQMELRLVSRHDTLTGTLTRSAFDARLRSEFEARDKTPKALLLLDIDHFKSINDTFGHATGDTALRAVGAILKKNLRESDLIGRYGGEEFLVLLRNVTPDVALAQSERLRRSVSQLKLPELGGRRLTISIGLASYTESVTSIEDWLRRADKSLYDAKHAGRNQVVAA
ncbi:sensor domain-containing diguanylate cyclase [Roseinatronobacter sp. S2]|uniref:sensor domain-containing diguanylate cyclase n=1 Tax=Roseinatronobacter sp. S2 TaxID=3035471 RepID=UPI00240FBFBD|nr:sensor domain-containing diguanylate cyclase [Roseinatronobacter sp. S2]WFE74833.1 sensor domain-containing diguanylate cyclase [Roseinatronobacter sp. S2]